jgi:APA family basic amino acid/polyamine antiporter
MSSSQHGNGEPIGLVRQLGLFDSIMMMVGVVIGSGIFLTTGLMASVLPSPLLILLAWLVGGLLTLAGALSFAELGAMMPHAGGHYVYLKEAYGPLSGFLFGWILFWVSMTGSIAAVAVAFAEYFGAFVPVLSTERVVLSIGSGAAGAGFTISAGQLVAVGLIAAVSLFNYVGVGLGKGLQNVVTLVKIGTLVLLVGLGFAIGSGAPFALELNPTRMGAGQLITGFGVALIAVSWAFDGWNNINYIAGEIRNPGRNLPATLLYGTFLITLLYMLVNWVYLYALPISDMAGVVPIAERAGSALFGPTSAGLISAMVLVSVFGALHGAIIVGARVYYAMARDGLFFRRAGQVSPRFLTPGPAILFQAIWACVLTVSGTFEQLFTFVMFITILYWVAATAAVFTLRRKRPDLPRPYRTWGYPVVPAIFIVASLGILLNTLIERPVESGIGLLLLLSGLPAYFIWARKAA